MVPAVLTRLVCIGGSAGAVEALSIVLPALPASTPFPVVIVVHLPPKEPSLLAKIFAAKCALPVREAEDKNVLTPGVWFAPPDYHLLIEPDGACALSVDEAVNFSRPSIDVLFETAADAFGAGVVGVVLTGASHDGAAGATAIKAAGGRIYVQAPAQAAASTMPLATLQHVQPDLTGTLAELAAQLKHLAETNDANANHATS